MPKDALPDRYVVDRKGSPDPADAQYYVLDVVHDRHARVVLGRLLAYYRVFGQQVAADELEKLLNSTVDIHREVVQRQAEALLPKTPKSSSRRSKTATGEPVGRM